MPPTKALSRDDYTVGWVTALPLELAAATAMLDEEHKRPFNFRQPSTDHNTYTWGCIEGHNVVLASLPAGVYGTVSAATVASSLLSSFPHLQVGLMVGIGAGIPRPGYDIRLGDVVVSNPGGRTGGVIQYDLGKKLAGGRFERKGSLSMPPEVLLTALATLQARHERQPSNVPQILEQMLQKNPFMAEPQDERPGYGYQGEENDRLFAPDYQHVGGLTCEECDRVKEVERKNRKSSAPQIHYGIIASGNTLVKDSSTRDSIIEGLDEDCICFEMEAAGLMNSFPCLVIRGICDYADSHKNDRWQRCAAAAAAAYAKEFLSVVPQVSAPSPRRTNKPLTDEEKQSLILKALKFDAMDERFHDVSKEAENTFRWIFEDNAKNYDLISFKPWLTSGSGIFHICGKLGSGKSTLMKYICQNSQTAESLNLWAQERQQKLVIARFFFWKPGSPRQKSTAGLVRSLLAQILRQCPEMVNVSFPSNLESVPRPLLEDGFDVTINDNEALEAFDRLIHDKAIRSTHCFCFFIDGLDEFEENYRTHENLVQDLSEWVSGGVVKLCASSRELDVFESRLAVSQRIKLQDLTFSDIHKLACQTLNNHPHFQRLRSKDPGFCKALPTSVSFKADGVFLWTILTLKLLSEALENRYSVVALRETLRDIPNDLQELFQRLLNSIPNSQRQKSFCMLSIAVKLYELCSHSYSISTLSPIGHVEYARFTLLRASFLSDYFEDPKFTAKRGFQEMSDQEINDRLIESKAQWTGRCKGLLEVRHNYHHIREAIVKDELKFIHRSIPEYLQEHGSHFDDIEIFDPLLQSFLAVVQAVPLKPHMLFLSSRFDEIKVLLLVLREYPMTTQLHYFPLLEQIETASRQGKPKIWPDFSKRKWNRFPFKAHASLSVVVNDYSECYSLPHMACETVFHEYIQWMAEHTPAFNQVGERGSVEYLASVFSAITREENFARVQETLKVLFQQGCNPNWSRDLEYYHEIFDFWLWVLPSPSWGKTRVSQKSWRLVELFLEFGAYHPQWTCDFSKSQPEVTVTFGKNKSYSLTLQSFQVKANLSCLPPCLRQSGGRADLKDWVEYEKPENMEAILRLLKQPNHPPPPTKQQHYPSDPLSAAV